MNINTYLKKYLKPLLNKQMVVLDATVGNGNDTLFLCENCKFVYGFDIQKEALIKASKKLINYNNYKLYLSSHHLLADYIKEELDLAIFNLGYLPNSHSKIKTIKETTVIAIDKAYKLLKNGAYLCLSIYFHSYDEFHAINNFLENKQIKILHIYRDDKVNSALLYIIRKVIT